VSRSVKVRLTRLYCGLQNAFQLDPLLAQRDLALADPRDVEQIIDKTGKMENLSFYLSTNDFGGVRVPAFPQKFNAYVDDGEWVAQLMPEHSQEFILAAVRLAQCLRDGFQLVALAGNLFALPVQVEEYVGLAAQDVGFDGFLNEINCARFITAKAA